MKKYLSIIVLAASLAACSEQTPEPTAKERVLMQIYGSYQTALAYDEVCNETEETSGQFSEEKSALLQGHKNLLTDRLLEVRQLRLEEQSHEKLEDDFALASRMIKKQAVKNLKKQGCETKAAQAAGRLWHRYTNDSVEKMSSFVDEQIAKYAKITTTHE